ncbi:hypothetical protein B6K86_01380 [Lachnospiraceae bacterium]|nr:hypothetical protein B6K86_01380 [Lachnospiraceae bacterium]
MKRFWLVVNRKKVEAPECAERVRQLLFSEGAEAVRASGSMECGMMDSKTDCVITLGGDGTMIRAARCIAGSGIPIVGINLGHMGYLTAVNREAEIPALIRALLQDRVQLEERMMLESRLIDETGAVTDTQLALNELVVSRRYSSGPIHFEVCVNGVFLNEYKADGIIISTPTGSTAYNLSAGGPIVDPVARMKILTPICPHALNRSSIVLRAEDRLEVVIPKETAGTPSVSFDGALVRELRPGSRVLIEESKSTTRLIRLEGGSFLSQLREKMSAL